MKRMAPTGGISRDFARSALLFATVWLFACACALAQALQPLELREAVRSGIESEAPRSVRLPDKLDFGFPDERLMMPSYRLEANLGAAPSRVAIYLPGVFAHSRIAINGQVLSDHIVEPLPPRPRSIDRLRLLEVPDAFVRPGLNRIDITLAAPRLTSLSEVWIGPLEPLRAMRDRKAFLVVFGPAMVATIMGGLGVVVLLLYARRRQEALYGYFGVGALAWALHTGWTTVLPRTLLSGVHNLVWWTTLYTFFVAMLIIFCLRLTSTARPAYDRALWSAAVAAPFLLYGASAVDLAGEAAEYWRLMWIGIVSVALVIVARHAWRQRDTAGALLVLTGLVGAVFGMRDWTVFHFADDNFPVALTPYSGLLFIGLVAWILIDRFARAAESLESVNRELEQRVARKNAQLTAALDEMRAAKEAAESANRAKSTFLAAASHDLRQPIHALGLYMAALRTEGLNLPQRELLQRMASSLSALDSMFNALLDISRMDGGAVQVRPRPFALEPMLHRLAEEFAPVAADKGLRLSVWVAPDARLLNAYSDPLLVERIVRNLVANAVKYTEDGGVLLSLRLRGVRRPFHVVPADARWRVEVWDTGPGIPDAERERVFEEFYQVGNPERDRASGLGLGLSIVRRLTLLLSHRLELHSVPERGTRFVLELPVTDEAPEVEPQIGLAGSLQGLCVAVVEDDPEVRDGMQVLLARWGCDVIAAAEAHEVLQRAGPERQPHAVLADFRLREGRTGIEAVRLLREACGEEIPALIVTGDSAPERLAELDASGLPWLNKPVAAARLRSWLIQAARLRRGVQPVREPAP